MAFPLIFIGLVLIVVGVRDQTEEFQTLLASDFLGDGRGAPFVSWIVAVLVLAAIGSYKPLRGLSDGFLVLLAAVILLSNRGFFVEFQKQVLTP